MSVALVTVVSGAAYERYAETLVRSAAQFFRPDGACETLVLPGRSGWPDATLYRYHALLEHGFAHDYVYLCDADMLVVSPIGSEVLGDRVSVLHPGYVGAHVARLPYERRRESAAAVRKGEGTSYYAGGFVGGRRDAFFAVAERIAQIIDDDASRGVIPLWHDESVYNRVLIDSPPTVVLSPSYCFPDNSSFYEEHIWKETYDRRIVALDKTAHERRNR